MPEPEQERETTADAARDALVRSVVVYGVQLVITAGVVIVARNKGWFEHQWWALKERRRAGRPATRVDMEMQRARRGLHDDIRRFEAGEE